MKANLNNTILGDVLFNAKSKLLMRSIWIEVFKDKSFQQLILDWIRYDQLFKKGVDENDDVIGYYSAFTEFINPEKVEGTPYTLFDSGDFYRSMMIVVRYDSAIEIDADPIKIDDGGDVENLFEKYGDGIIGPNDETRQKLANECVERFNHVARNILSNHG